MLSSPNEYSSQTSSDATQPSEEVRSGGNQNLPQATTTQQNLVLPRSLTRPTSRTITEVTTGAEKLRKAFHEWQEKCLEKRLGLPYYIVAFTFFCLWITGLALFASSFNDRKPTRLVVSTWTVAMMSIWMSAREFHLALEKREANLYDIFSSPYADKDNCCEKVLETKVLNLFALVGKFVMAFMHLIEDEDSDGDSKKPIADEMAIPFMATFFSLAGFVLIYFFWLACSVFPAERKRVHEACGEDGLLFMHMEGEKVFSGITKGMIKEMYAEEITVMKEVFTLLVNLLGAAFACFSDGMTGKAAALISTLIGAEIGHVVLDTIASCVSCNVDANEDIELMEKKAGDNFTKYLFAKTENTTLNSSVQQLTLDVDWLQSANDNLRNRVDSMKGQKEQAEAEQVRLQKELEITEDFFRRASE